MIYPTLQMISAQNVLTAAEMKAKISAINHLPSQTVMNVFGGMLGVTDMLL